MTRNSRRCMTFFWLEHPHNEGVSATQVGALGAGASLKAPTRPWMPQPCKDAQAVKVTTRLIHGAEAYAWLEPRNQPVDSLWSDGERPRCAKDDGADFSAAPA